MVEFYLIHRLSILLIITQLLTACANVLTSSPKIPRAQITSRFNFPPQGTEAVGNLVAIHAHAEDTLLDIARYFDVGHNAILNANPKIDPWLPGKGTRVILPTQHILPPAPRQGIVVNLGALRLFYYPNKQTIITHPTGIGRENWVTPQGNTKVVAKDIDPPWRVPKSIRDEHANRGNLLPAIVPPGPNNPLGQYALRLGIAGYLIHGTNRPYGIGMRVSHGCIQLYPEDISALFHEVPIGTPVVIINRPYLAGRIAGRPYLEVHPPHEDDPLNHNVDLMEQLTNIFAEAGIDINEIDWNLALLAVHLSLGIPIPIYRGAPNARLWINNINLVETNLIKGSWD